MTVPANLNRVDYTGTGSTGPFTVPFPFFDASHLTVLQTDALFNQTTLTGWTATGVGGPSGAVTLATACPVGSTLTIMRIVPMTQITSIKNQEAFYPEVHEQEMDLLAMADQQLDEAMDRTLRLPAGLSGVDMTLPRPDPGHALVWNAAGDGLENAGSASATLQQDLADSADVAKGDEMIAVKQPFTGAVARTQHDKNAEWVSVLDFGAINFSITDTTEIENNTANIQYCLDNFDFVRFPAGIYCINELFFRKDYQTIIMEGAVFKGCATTETEAVVHIQRRMTTIYNLDINADYNVNYNAALQWHDDVDGDGYYPNNCRLFGLRINSAKIGLLFGAMSNPIDSPVSENHIIGFVTRGCIKTIYCNQPNGFLHITNATIDCQKYEWDIYSPGTYLDIDACCVTNIKNELFLTNCEFVKASSAIGYGIINNSKIVFNNCSAEIASTNFYLDNNSETYLSNYSNNYWNNATSELITIGGNGVNYLFANQIHISKGLGGVGAGFPIIKTNGYGDTVKITNMFVKNQNISCILSSQYLYWFIGNTRIVNSFIGDTTDFRTLDMGSHNLAHGYIKLDIANFTTALGVGTTATIVDSGHSKFSKAIKIVGAVGQSAYVSTKLDTGLAIYCNDNKYLTVEITMKAVANGTLFYGRLDVLWYDDADSYITSTNLSDGAGGIAHLTVSEGTQDWKTVSRILAPPAKAAKAQFRFGTNSYLCELWIGAINIF